MSGHATTVSVPQGRVRPGPWQGGWRDGLSYGALGLPLAFVALPLYVVLPSHYASQFGVPLAWLGALLLAARLFDAATDPLIGRWCDAWFAKSSRHVLGMAAFAALALSLGFVGLFFPPVRDMAPLLAWCGAMLLLSYGCYSVLSIAHQSWGARLGGDAAQRADIVAWREGLALAGVLLASLLPSLAGMGVTSAVLALALLLGLAGLWHAPEVPKSAPATDAADMRLALTNRSFRQLLWIYLLNGIASAIPATLVLFFIRDRLQAPDFEAALLGAYFAAAALSMPLWLRAVRRFGLVRSWLGGMLLAIAAFVWATTLGAGDVVGFAAVCVGSGIALGADLSVPGALLAGVIRKAGHEDRLEGLYFGWWNMATKLNLALAAGIALPMLGLFGYTPGSRDPQALAALTWVYCALPCALKLVAAALLYSRHRRGVEGFCE